MNTYQPPAASVLASLRSLVPRRQLTFTEARRIAEIQAARLLQLLDLTDLPVPDEAITELPRIRIQHVRDLPTSGISFWDGQNWIIQLSGLEPLVRQRFTLFHEYKHIIDHYAADRLYTGDRHHSAAEQAELVADYFAGCTLIPRRALKSAWGRGIQRPAALAEHFATSVQAIEVRLDQTGLREPRTRCTPFSAVSLPNQSASSSRHYRTSTLRQTAGAA